MAKFLGKLVSNTAPLAKNGGAVSATEQLQSFTTVIGKMVIASIAICDSAYTALDDTAVSSGGYLKIRGSGFSYDTVVYINAIAVSTTFANPTEIRVITPTLAAGVYSLTAFNSIGVGAMLASGIRYSGMPAWTYSSYAATSEIVNTQLLVSGDGPLTYYLQSGSSLPPGITLYASGLLTGTIPGITSSTIYTFTVLVDDVQLQTTQQTITLTVLLLADLYFNSNALLITGDGTSGTQNNTFLDSSANNVAVTSNGVPTQGTFTPFSHAGWSGYFNGTTDYLTTPSTTNYNLGAGGDFTVESWIYVTATGNNTILTLGTGGSATYWLFQVNSNGSMTWQSNSGNWAWANTYTTAASIVTTNVWTHVAAVRAGNNFNIYVNGISQYFTTSFNAGTGAGGTLYIGTYYANYNNDGSYFRGYISNLRIVKGSAVYTANFIPPTAPITSTQVYTEGSRPSSNIPTSMEVYAWGAGGGGGTAGGWSYGSAGGAGGAAYGVVSVTATTNYSIIVGGGGQVNSSTSAVGGGGIANRSGGDNRYGSGGGGYSGIFNSTPSQLAALIIAGGGGGGGSSRAGTGNTGGGGGGGGGQDGTSPYDSKTAYAGKGGTLIAAGADATCDSANAVGYQGALQGGTCRINGYGGAGGGGYWGGSAGGYSEANTMAGGGGGSGYVNTGVVLNGTLTAGVGTTAGDNLNSLRGTAGNAGAVAAAGLSGIVIIRYLSSYAAAITTGSPSVVVSGGYRTYTWTTSGSISFSNGSFGAITGTQTGLLTLQSGSIKDNSINNVAITIAGTASMRAVSPYAPATSYNTSLIGGSIYFNGTTDYLTVAQSYTPGNFTIEMWAYPTASGGCFCGSTTTSGWELYMSTNEVRFINQGAVTVSSGLSVKLNAWNHVVVCRYNYVSGVSGGYRIFVNGVMYDTGGTVTGGSTALAGTSPFAIGTSLYNGAGSPRNYFTGYISNFRFVDGAGVIYLGSYAPPTAPFIAVQSYTTANPLEVNVWGAGGAAGGTGGGAYCYGGGGGFARSTIYVNQGVTYTISVGGGGQLGSQGCVAGGGGTGGTGTYGGAGGTGTGAGSSPCSGSGGGGGGASFFMLASAILVAGGGGGGGGGTESGENSSGQGGAGGQNGNAGAGTGATGGIVGGNTGFTNGLDGIVGGVGGDHSGAGGAGGGYVGGTPGTSPSNDGVSGGGGGGGSNYGTVTMAGAYQTPGNSSDPLRSTYATGGGTGTAGGAGVVVIRYPDTVSAAVTTGNPTITASGGYRIYTWTTSGTISFNDLPSNTATSTLLLLGTNGGIIDAVSSDVKTVGSVQVNTATVKYGTGSIQFNGTTDYLTIPAGPTFIFNTGNFTIEFWAYLNTSSQSCTFLDFRPATTNGLYPNMGLNAGVLNMYTNATQVITGATLAISTWYHIALVRSAGVTILYLNGAVSGSTYTDTNNYNIGTVLSIGGSAYTLGSGLFNGYIDDLRITRGVARYTTAFTPPVALRQQ